MTESPTESVNFLDAIKNLGKAIDDFRVTLKQCRENGMTDIDIRNEILAAMPEEDRPAFIQQWPYFSMMLNVL